ncbi:MAG: ribonuclease Y [Verrucomicrobia bacterium]|nr:ribonuclease Y [Verrucomicrobiota bacterium]
MDADYTLIGEGALVFITGAATGLALLRWRDKNVKAAQEVQRQTLLDNARRDADALTREAKLKANEVSLKLREETEKSFATRREEAVATERRLAERESLVNRQLESLHAGEKKLGADQEATIAQRVLLETRSDELERLTTIRKSELQSLAKLSEQGARAHLMREVEQAALKDAAGLTKHILEDAKAKAEEKARRIICLAVQRYAAEATFDTTTATIALTGDDIKGRIIGREGRNIRAFEAVTGITVMIDDTPGCVVLSGFDPVRREVAREAMQRLILDGRIHPTRIEEIVAKVKEEMTEAVVRYGEEAIAKAGLAPMHPEVTVLLGKLRFRNSFSQNVLDHSVEVAHLIGLMAAELGLDVNEAKRAGLLHDLGKAVSHEIEGPHAIVGADILKRHGESPAVINAVASHHDEVPHEGPLGILVSAADAISGSRPGARSETMTTYLKRLEDLENIGMSFPGVEKAYAVQAGRELRIFVLHDQVTDDEAAALARNIVRRIEEQLQYPGQIRVTVIRETRVVEFAK